MLQDALFSLQDETQRKLSMLLGEALETYTLPRRRSPLGVFLAAGLLRRTACLVSAVLGAGFLTATVLGATGGLG